MRIISLFRLGLLSVGVATATVPQVVWAERGEPMMTVRFAPERDYGPFVFRDDTGAIRGLSVDMLKAVAERAHLAVQTLPAQNLAAILDAVRRGEVDLVSSLRPTPERAEYLSFTKPYVSVPAVLVRRANQDNDLQLSDLSGQPVAVGQGYAVEAFVRRAFPDVHWVAVTDDRAALNALLAERVTGVVADMASVTFLKRRYHLDRLRVVGAIGYSYPLSFAFAKDKPEIGVALEAGLVALGVAGRDAIVDRWVDDIALTYRDSRTHMTLKIAAFLILVSGALLGLAVWQRTRRHASAS